MPPSPREAIAALARRAAAGAFVGGALRALVVVAVLGTAAQIAARLFGAHLAPQPAWAAAAVPVLIWGATCARRERPSTATAAGHLDRRLELGGLLVSAQEGVVLDDAQQRQLTRGLQGLPAALPRIRWRALLPWPFAATLLVVGTALLPPPPKPPLPLSVAAAGSEVERLEERLRDLLARGDLPEETQRELTEKLQELQQRLQRDDVPDWRDLDELDRRLDREQLLQAAAEQPAHGDPQATPGAAGSDLSAASLAAAAEALSAAGLIDGLPAGLQAMLDAARQADGSFAASAMPQDAEALRRLAEAMAQVAGQPGALQSIAALADGQLADLRDVLSQCSGAGRPGGALPGEGAGRGGVDRGPGHAALAMTEDAQGSADGAMPLPPGAPVPTEWVPLGSRRVDPQAAPVANTATGGQGAAGAGGATWQLTLPPHQRAVVQRFFAGGLPPASSKDK